MREEWLELAMELQALAQAGLEYGHDCYDLERYERIRQIAARMVAVNADLPLEKVTGLFCNETGYQTPKMETRAVIVNDRGEILLVHENNGLWALPGGWMDVLESVASNTVKETREEAGLDVVPKRIIAVQDRNKHNVPVYAYGVCKVFVLCEVIGGHFEKNIETTETGYFPLDALPPLAEEKNSAEQIAMCVEAAHDPNWQTLFD